MNTTAPTACPSWTALAAHAESSREVHLRELFAPDAVQVSNTGGIYDLNDKVVLRNSARS